MSYMLRRPAVPTAHAPREEIARIIAERRFSLALQPVVGINSRAPDHAEALLRLPAPLTQPPRSFVAAADAAGLGPALDAAVLAMACRAPSRVSINICARSLQHPGFVRAVLDAGAQAIELVRGDTIDDVAAVAGAVNELRACAVSVALDEFDGGTASLALLQAARFDALKLSGTVVRGAITGPRGRSLLTELLRLGEAVGGRMVATQIETLPQLWAMQRAGIDLAQGWLLGAPAAWPGANPAT